MPRAILKNPIINLTHQEDVERRDRLMRSEASQEKDYPQVQEMMLRALRKKAGKAEAEAEEEGSSVVSFPAGNPSPPKNFLVPPIEIAAIRAIGFHRHMIKEGTETFITSLDESTVFWKKKRSPRELEDDENREVIPDECHEYLDVFSTSKSNEMLPYRKGVDQRRSGYLRRMRS